VGHAEARISLQGKDHASLPLRTTAPDTTPSRNEQVFRQGLDIARDLKQGPTSYAMTLEALDLGAVTLVAVPGELFLELGEAIRSSSANPANPVIVLGYANGYLGYLPTRNAPLGYEVVVSPVAAGSGERVVEACRGLLAQLAKPDPDAPAHPATELDHVEPEPLENRA
jgi:hypothetical protein